MRWSNSWLAAPAPFGLVLSVFTGLMVLVGFAVRIAYDGDAVRPRHALRADVLGCYELIALDAVPAGYRDDVARMRLFRLRAEVLEPGRIWQRVDLPRPCTNGRPLAWGADSLTDTVRLGWSDGFVGVTFSFSAPTGSSSWTGSARAWTDVVGADVRLGRFRAQRIPCVVRKAF